MSRVDLSEAKRQLGTLIDVALSGEEVLITQDHQPVLKLARVTKATGPRKAGSAKGLIKLASDFDAPLEDFQPYME
jgi:antitoxin (DNA-binding transcriptional repressor) of toxin-antitoxin stability system